MSKKSSRRSHAKTVRSKKVVRVLSKAQKQALQKSRDLYFQACEADTIEKAVELLDQSLDVEPFCADALLMRAELTATDPEEVAYLSRLAMGAGLLEIGENAEAYKGCYWGFLETRPFMRALEVNSRALRELTAFDRAINQYGLMLELNPNDNQGVRYELLTLLVEQERYEDARELIKHYDEDACVVWTSMKLLLAYQKGSTEDNLKKMLKEGDDEASKAMVSFLTDRKRFVTLDQPMYQARSKEEARAYYPNVRIAWESVPNALEWLKSQT